ncbi:MAG: DUF4936 family protein [Pseudomonadota bacterium]
MLTSQRALFIYYKLDPAHTKGFKVAAQQMQLQLVQAHPGLIARLWERGDAADLEQTWMESYEHPLGIDNGLAEQIDQSMQSLPSGRTGPRHLEMFVSVQEGADQCA